MSVLTIVVLAVVVVALVTAVLYVMPRAWERRRLGMRERELNRRREQVVKEERAQAASRSRLADEADQRARIAAREARRERADAQLSQERALLHERRMADDELVTDDERERFAGTSAVSGRDARRSAHDSGIEDLR
jgi:hypothetical protein